MARPTHTYAIRLAVEGGGQVKAELVSVGQSGEQSLKRIESAGDKASGGLKGLGRQAEVLRTGMRRLGGALLAQVVLTRAVSFADDFAGAWAYAGVSATAATVLDVHKKWRSRRHDRVADGTTRRTVVTRLRTSASLAGLSYRFGLRDVRRPAQGGRESMLCAEPAAALAAKPSSKRGAG